MKKRVLFIDRDGTLIKEPVDFQVDDISKVEFYPKMISSLNKIAEQGNFELVMVTNQDGLGTDSFPEDTFWPAHNFVLSTLKNEEIVFQEVVIDRTFPKDNKPTRKPGTALLQHFFTKDYDLKESYVIGDRLTDMELAVNLGAKGIYINNQNNLGASEVKIDKLELEKTIVLETNNWKEICELLTQGKRRAQLSRKTHETEITMALDLDGTGKSDINTGIAFFDHMLDQLSRHGQIDLSIHVDGDLEIDEHHTIEDTAIVLGQLFTKALGDKAGIERYGFCLPMDDCLAQVAVDFGGRNWLEWDAEFKREMIGKMPTEMFYHFFKSFTDGANANLNIKAEGRNEHHKIEAIFKAFAKAIRAAVNRDQDKMILPTTKGML